MKAARNRSIWLALACGALSASPSGASAQNRDVVFQHGLASDSTTWMPEASTLFNLFLITPYTRSTLWYNPYASQASNLASLVSPAAANAIVIAHSNGAAVARTANMPSPYPGRSWGGVVTVGGVNGGAPLEASVSLGAVGYWITSDLDDIQAADDYYRHRVPNEGLDHVLSALYWTVEVSSGILSWLNLVCEEFCSSVPVAADMPPGSTALNTLNDSVNLAREGSAIPVRIGIVSTVSNTGLPWRAMFSDWGPWKSTADVSEDVFWLAFSAAVNYQPECDGDQDCEQNAAEIRDHAYMWSDAALDLGAFDDDYCIRMGAWDYANGNCGPSDAILPTWSQEYPGKTEGRNVSGPAHSSETTSSEVDQVLRALLSGTFAVAPRPPSGGGGPAPTINGPTRMQPGDLCHWSATTNITNPHYEWKADGTVVGSSAQLEYTSQDSFMLALRVWNDSGAQGSVSHPIAVSTGYTHCAQ